MERGGLKIFAGGPPKASAAERYLRSVKTRERCKLSDAIDTEEIRQSEREEDIMAGNKAGSIAKAASGAVGDAMDVDGAVY